MTHPLAPSGVCNASNIPSSPHHQGKGSVIARLAVRGMFATALLVCGLAHAQNSSDDPANPPIVKGTPTSGKTPGTLIRLSNESFEFGAAIIGSPVVRTVAVVTNNTNWTVPLQFRLTGDPSYSVVTESGCGASLTRQASCNLQVSYNPQTASSPKKQKATLLVASIEGERYSFFNLTLTGISGAMSAGVVTPTRNSMVAQYALTLPFQGTWKVSFGKTNAYGFDTSGVPSPTAGVANTIYVAGMQANTVYHMRASVTLPNGATATDVDHTFTTGDLPAGLTLPLTVTTTPGLTPQPGIELIDTVVGPGGSAAYATDLAGNIIWTYPFPDRQWESLLYPIKQMPNGNMLMLIAPNSVQFTPIVPFWLNLIRIVDLAGNTVQELSMAELNSRLQTAGYTDLSLLMYSHEINLLPNGHILVMANMLKPFTDLPGYPGITNVLGDVIVDLDKNLQPVWAWNSFDHLDINRHPMYFPDWTHGNALLYSPEDGNFMISMRHQNWVVKVNYRDGQGDGSIAWKLGYEGDFDLQGATGRQDWFYAQHTPAAFSPNTTGVFSLGLMDNGDDRWLPDGRNCIFSTLCYTTVPVYKVDEVAKTATLIWRQTLSSDLYSSFAGDVQQLGNGNVEYNLAGVGHSSHIFEVTPDANPTTVWHLSMPGTNTYRAFRLPSLYPGVQW